LLLIDIYKNKDQKILKCNPNSGIPLFQFCGTDIRKKKDVSEKFGLQDRFGEEKILISIEK